MSNGWRCGVAVLALVAPFIVIGSTQGSNAPPGVRLTSDWLLHSFRDAQLREDARQAFVRSPEARAAREDSQTAFGRKTAERAAAVAVEHFGGLVRDPFWESVEARTGARVLEYRNDR